MGAQGSGKLRKEVEADWIYDVIKPHHVIFVACWPQIKKLGNILTSLFFQTLQWQPLPW